MLLESLLNSADFHSVSVVRTRDGSWQANLQSEKGINSFRVMHGATPAEAIAELFSDIPRVEIPCPVPACPVPPCPVPA